MRKDVTEKDIKKAMKEFGLQVNMQARTRQDMVIAKLREEIDRLRPQAQRLLHGEPQTALNRHKWAQELLGEIERQ